jgi:hypothetical protein
LILLSTLTRLLLAALLTTLAALLILLSALTRLLLAAALLATLAALLVLLAALVILIHCRSLCQLGMSRSCQQRCGSDVPARAKCVHHRCVISEVPWLCKQADARAADLRTVAQDDAAIVHNRSTQKSRA